MKHSLSPGKIPNRLLASLIDSLGFIDDSLIVPPGIGQDVAVIDGPGSEYLVLKSDPITFATDRIGFYAVNINANDIATAGATPRWFLATALLPVGMYEPELKAVFSDLAIACSVLRITLCGGHTEITDAVQRPVISGTLIGTVEKDRLIRKEHMGEGDRLIMTKSAGFEGTSVMAREFPERLMQNGMTAEEVSAGAAFLDRLSVLDDARIAISSGSVTAMHDVTEGGVATALRELSTAGGNRFCVNVEAIPVHPITRKMCRIFGLHPMGLIGSGSLLLTASPQTADTVLSRLHGSGIEAVEIGTVLDEGDGIDTDPMSAAEDLPEFSVDEITHLYS